MTHFMLCFVVVCIRPRLIGLAQSHFWH